LNMCEECEEREADHEVQALAQPFAAVRIPSCPEDRLRKFCLKERDYRPKLKGESAIEIQEASESTDVAEVADNKGCTKCEGAKVAQG